MLAARLLMIWCAVYLLAIGGCGPTDETEVRSSILLVVIDTLRADAVSAYGGTAGVTPELDALAAEGLLYERAFAPSPWTIPSHATLFTGLGPEQHGTGLHGRMVLPDGVVTLAERLRAAGYRTAAFSENSLIDAPFGFHQGFDHAVTRSASKDAKRELMRRPRFDLLTEMRQWLEGVDPHDPLFVFLNLYGAHAPYSVREENPFVPAGLPIRDEDIRQPGVPAGAAIAYSAGICDRIPTPDAIEVLRGLYLGDVAAEDAQLAELRALLAPFGNGWITIVTSDHGEHFGEHRLLGHEFSVREAALRVPLVVHGLDEVAPAQLRQPVRLADVAVSILGWAGLEPPNGLSGRRLPTSTDEPASDRALLAVFTDTPGKPPGPGWRVQEKLVRGKRSGCRDSDRVFGHTYALMRFPYKLIAFERHPSELYDLSWDERERSNLAEREPDRLAQLERELARLTDATQLAPPDDVPALSPEMHGALEALGYTE